MKIKQNSKKVCYLYTQAANLFFIQFFMKGMIYL